MECVQVQRGPVREDEDCRKNFRREFCDGLGGIMELGLRVSKAAGRLPRPSLFVGDPQESLLEERLCFFEPRRHMVGFNGINRVRV